MKANYTIVFIGAFCYFAGWSLRYFTPMTNTMKIIGGGCIILGLALFAYFILTMLNKAEKPPTEDEKKDSNTSRHEAEQKRKQ